MPTLVESKKSIEGEKIEGQSRKPLSFGGMERCNEINCYQFIARFDVKSLITEILEATTRMLFPSAHVALGDNVLCELAVIHSVKNKYSQYLKSNASGTHGASSWSFPNQTNVMILHSHQEIQNAMETRLLKAKKKILIGS